MADYPTSEYAPRTKANQTGIVYDETKEKVIFKEDFDSLENEIKAIENALGFATNGLISKFFARRRAGGTNYYGSNINAAGTTTGFPAAGYILAGAFYCAKEETFDRVAIYVTTADAANPGIILGIYADDGTGKPGALIADFGAVSAATTGLKEININLTLGQGVYWLCYLIQGSPALRVYSGGNIAPMILGIDPSTFNGFFQSWMLAQAYGALPASLAGATQQAYPIIVIALRKQ